MSFALVCLLIILATERLILHIGQRIRWARGMTQIFRIDNPLTGKGLKVTRIARGLPVGGELEHVDSGTLAQAILERRPA